MLTLPFSTCIHESPRVAGVPSLASLTIKVVWWLLELGCEVEADVPKCLELELAPSNSCEAHGAGVDAHIDGADVLSVSSNGGALAADLFKLTLGRGVSAGGSFKPIHGGCSDDSPLRDKPAKDAIMDCE